MSLKVKMGLEAAQFTRALNKVKKGVRGFGRSLTSMKSALAGVAVAMGAAFAARKIFDFISSSSKAAANIEDLTLQFETLTKSATITKDLIAEMKSDATKSPLSIADYAQAGKTLLAFGIEAEKIMPSLRDLADISMGNSERFRSLALAFAQTQAAGRLMGQEVLQFVNAGFNPLQQISKKTGETMIVLKKRMEDGAISSREVADAFKAATAEGGLFYKAIERGSTTTSGKIAKMKDSVLSVQIAFGTGFNEGLKDALGAMSGGIPKLEKLASEMGNTIGLGISEAVNGDTDRLVGVGVLIGELISGGIKIGMSDAWQGIGGFMNQRKNWITGEVNPDDLKQQDSDKKYMRRELVRELIESLQAGMRELTPSRDEVQDVRGRGVPGQPGWEYAREGQPATIMDGERVVRILESIDQSLTKPFPN